MSTGPSSALDVVADPLDLGEIADVGCDAERLGPAGSKLLDDRVDSFL